MISIRRDVTLEPTPRTIDQLAARLLHPGSLAAACALLSLPELQVAEAAAALGDRCTAAGLAALLGVPSDDADLAAALRRLTGLTLLWPLADGLAAAQLNAMWPYPLELGPSAAESFAECTLRELRGFARVYGVAGRGKNELVAALSGWLAQPGNVRGLVAEAPAEVRDRLDALARRRPSSLELPMLMMSTPEPPLPWAAERGLVVESPWGSMEVPREVALVLRGAGSAPFEPRPPAVPVTPVPAGHVEREAAAAASETLEAVMAVVEAVGGARVPLLKSGGLGVRELRRIVRASGQDEDRTRLTVELLVAGGLMEASEAGLARSAAYDEFATAAPADRLLDVVRTWLTMPACPLAPADPTAVSARVLYWDEEEEHVLAALRVLTLRTVVDAVAEGLSAEPGALGDRIRWRSPVVAGQAGEDLSRYVTGIWREAHRLGLLAHGSPSALCRNLLLGDAEAADRQAEVMLPEQRNSVVLQNDLTAVVTGVPSAGLLALLDGAATPESRSGAWTWRFSATSVRGALDAGTSAADLLARLTEVAEGGRVPQTIAYLISDVARRHGRIQVRPALCCLCSDDEALLTEVLNTRSLKGLELVRLAPTVLVSEKEQAETLAALRAAGYAPVGTRADGSPVIQVPRRRRAAVPDEAPEEDEMFRVASLADPAELARTVLGRR